MFVHRDELAAYWDFSIYLHVDLAVSLRRMVARDGLPVDAADRYTGAQRIYAQTCEPTRRASVVVDNTDLAAPGVIIPAR